MKYIIVALVFLATSTLAADFSSRVNEGNELALTMSGKQYDQKLGPFIGDIMRLCIPPGSTNSTNLGTFSLVAIVSNQGASSGIEVKPFNSISKCFSKKITRVKLPTPPEQNSLLMGYPITITVTVKP
ncbi:MAG: hypothetical protein COA86_03460 [Kangiella sp.]|nr:MAG: hypothetical protein COA86_03460 [Kangiella sp.]